MLYADFPNVLHSLIYQDNRLDQLSRVGAARHPLSWLLVLQSTDVPKVTTGKNIGSGLLNSMYEDVYWYQIHDHLRKWVGGSKGVQMHFN